MRKTNKGNTLVPILILGFLIVGVALFLYFILKTENKPQNSTSRAIKNNIENIKDSSKDNKNYTLVDTSQLNCYNTSSKINCPIESQPYFGQDSQYQGSTPSYVDNNDGTITDLNTGLVWQRDPGKKLNYENAISGADNFNFAGYSDWRVPTIKELYSLIDFRGTDPGVDSKTEDLIPFIDTDFFIFAYGDPNDGDRIIDSQWVTNTVYKSTVMNGQECFFGVNFADGRIKCYPTKQGKGYFVRYVRGNSYGINNFINNNDGTVTDISSGLVWQQNDSGQGLFWTDALSYCEDLSLAGFTDWRLPNAKELQSIVDYLRSPDTTNSAAINTLFTTSSITNEAGQNDYPFYWTSTTHVRGSNDGSNAVYISFGRAMGYMNGRWLDVHGAGAQRSDPKTGDPENYLTGLGPQGDARRILNYVRCVREGSELNTVQNIETAPTKETTPQPPDPPSVAIVACTNKTESTSCNINTPQGIVTGICMRINNLLACIPNNQ